jgi:predicted PurR-regulated permease PerM
MEDSNSTGARFLAALTVALIVASLWIFSPYLHYLVVAAVLALATSHGYNALVGAIARSALPGWIKRRKRLIAAVLLTVFFLLMIFAPLLYFASETYNQIIGLDIAAIKKTIIEMINQAQAFLDRIPVLQDLMAKFRAKSNSLVNGAAVEAVLRGAQRVAAGAGGLFGQVVWILIFYFLFNLYGRQILNFAAKVMPTSLEQEKYLYRECSGTVAVVFYGTIFNMFAQGLAFGVLMAFVGDYDAVYLGVLAGFCSVIPIIGAALVYVPVTALELFAGRYANAIFILAFAWVVMGFLIDNILRMVFIGRLKKAFGFEYMMNEILILLSILAGIATIGFWGLVIGPSVIALTLAAANLYSALSDEAGHEGILPEEND